MSHHRQPSTPPLTRRRFMATLAGMVTTLGLAACGAAPAAGIGSATASVATSSSAVSSAANGTTATATSTSAAQSATLSTSAATTASSSAVAAVSTAPASAGVKLEWIAKLKSIPQPQIDAFIKGFSDANPGITVELTIAQQTAAGLAKLKAIAASGEQLDVVSTLAGVPDLRQLGGAYPLNALIAQDHFDTSQFVQPVYKGVQVDGKVLALPHAYAGNELVLIANRGIFQKAGIALPSSWEQTWSWSTFRDALKRVTILSGPSPVVGTSRLGTVLDIPAWWNAQWMAPDNTTITCNSPAMIEAYTNYYDMVLKDRSASFSPNAPNFGKGEPFYSGKSATFTICCAVPTTTTAIKDVDWAFVPFPKAQRAAPDMGGTVIAIWSQTKHANEAWALLKYSVEQGRLAGLEERVPSQRSAIPAYVKQYYGSMPNVQASVFTATPDYIPDGLGNQDPLFLSPANTDAQNLIQDTLDKNVLTGKQTVQDALTSLKPQLEAMVKQYQTAGS
jgi:ABC-type glycerol-3-phosphate transport system substrate-binding protein